MNLISNAIKFTPDSGRVGVTLSRNGDGASLVVSDTGMGISEEDQEHLFTRFFRATAATEQAIQGTGLGLSIVHSIVTQHGGAVSIDSAPGRGTTVTVLLPYGAHRGPPPAREHRLHVASARPPPHPATGQALRRFRSTYCMIPPLR